MCIELYILYSIIMELTQVGTLGNDYLYRFIGVPWCAPHGVSCTQLHEFVVWLAVYWDSYVL